MMMLYLLNWPLAYKINKPNITQELLQKYKDNAKKLIHQDSSRELWVLIGEKHIMETYNTSFCDQNCGVESATDRTKILCTTMTIVSTAVELY